MSVCFILLACPQPSFLVPRGAWFWVRHSCGHWQSPLCFVERDTNLGIHTRRTEQMPLCLVIDGPIIIMLSYAWLYNEIQSHAHLTFTFCPLGISFDKPNTDLPSKPLPNIFFHLFLVHLLPLNFNGIYLGWPCVLPVELTTFFSVIFCPRVTRVPEPESSFLLMKTLAIIQLITDSHRTIDCSEGFDRQCEDTVEESAHLDWGNTVRVCWYMKGKKQLAVS